MSSLRNAAKLGSTFWIMWSFFATCVRRLSSAISITLPRIRAMMLSVYQFQYGRLSNLISYVSNKIQLFYQNKGFHTIGRIQLDTWWQFLYNSIWLCPYCNLSDVSHFWHSVHSCFRSYWLKFWKMSCTQSIEWRVVKSLEKTSVKSFPNSFGHTHRINSWVGENNWKQNHYVLKSISFADWLALLWTYVNTTWRMSLLLQ